MVVIDGVEMLDVREAAALVDRTPETIRRWIWSGRIPSHKRGNRLLIARRDLDARQSGDGDSPVTLAQWVRIARERVPAGHSSAADLVLADRSDRTDARARR